MRGVDLAESSGMLQERAGLSLRRLSPHAQSPATLEGILASASGVGVGRGRRAPGLPGLFLARIQDLK